MAVVEHQSSLIYTNNQLAEISDDQCSPLRTANNQNPRSVRKILITTKYTKNTKASAGPATLVEFFVSVVVMTILLLIFGVLVTIR